MLRSVEVCLVPSVLIDCMHGISAARRCRHDPNTSVRLRARPTSTFQPRQLSLGQHSVSLLSQKCLLFDKNSTVWTAKQIVLDRLARDLDDKINYGLCVLPSCARRSFVTYTCVARYLPASGGRAGKFLAEERLIGDYSLQGPVATLEFKYKRRV